MGHNKRLIIDYIYMISISIFIVFCCQIVYALLKVHVDLPKDYCKEYTTQMNDDDPIYCKTYKSKLIHAIINEESYLNQQGLSKNVYFLNLGIALFTGFVLNYFFFKQREINNQEIKGLWIKNSIKSAIVLPFLFMMVGGYFFPDSYYDCLVPKTIIEIREQRVDKVIDHAEWQVNHFPEDFENDPY